MALKDVQFKNVPEKLVVALQYLNKSSDTVVKPEQLKNVRRKLGTLDKTPNSSPAT